jgi:short-subunit dehydrogenase
VAVEAVGPIDILVNNAGIGLVGAFEATQCRKSARCSTPTLWA